ncbi:MAG: TIR domain-containing protein [candidate division Zixibacteria bacterium]
MAEKVFISFSTDWDQINYFGELISSLGFEPIIVEKKESLGKNPEDKALYYMEQCGKIIFIVTADTVDKNGKFHPKSNVAMEIGWSEKYFKDEDKIYILVDEAKLPSMKNNTYISFKEGNYIRAIKQLIKELGYKKSISVNNNKDEIDLSEQEIYCLFILANQKHLKLNRPTVFTYLNRKFNISTYTFNLAIANLIRDKFIAEGTVAGGQEYAGDIYFKILDRGIQLLDRISKMNKNKGEKTEKISTNQIAFLNVLLESENDKLDSEELFKHLTENISMTKGDYKLLAADLIEKNLIDREVTISPIAFGGKTQIYVLTPKAIKLLSKMRI